MKIKLKPKKPVTNFSFSENNSNNKNTPKQQSRELTDEHKAAILRAQQLRSEERELNADNALVIGIYRIRRLDEHNPCTVEKKKKREDGTVYWDLVGYFSAIDVALMCIFRNTTSDATAKTAKELVTAFKETEFKILKTLRDNKIHIENMDKYVRSRWLPKDELYSERNSINKAIAKLEGKENV